VSIPAWNFFHKTLPGVHLVLYSVAF
jgi:hypothetical protein